MVFCVILQSADNPFLMILGILILGGWFLYMLYFYAKIGHYIAVGIIKIIWALIKFILSPITKLINKCNENKLNELKNACRNLESRYPNAVKAFYSKNSVYSTYSLTKYLAKKMLAVDTEQWQEDENRLVEINRKNQEIFLKAQEIKHEYSEGYNEWLARLNVKTATNKAIIDAESVIIKYHKLIKKAQKFEDWERQQKEFSQQSLELGKKFFHDFGWYHYQIEWKTVDRNGNCQDGDYMVWQFFAQAVSLENDLDYSTVSYIEEHTKKLDEFKNRIRYFYTRIYDSIRNFVISQQNQYDDIVVFFNYTNKEWIDCSLDYHFKYLIEELQKSSIPYVIDSNEAVSIKNQHIIVIDMFTTNDMLKNFCKQIIDQSNIQRKITYISLIKCYERAEIVDIIKKEELRITKEKEERVNKEYERIKGLYPIGVSYYEKYERYYYENLCGKSIKEVIIDNIEKVAQYEKIYAQYLDLQRKYPKGLPAFERDNSFDDGKNSAELSMEEIVEFEDEIRRYDERINQYIIRDLFTNTNDWCKLGNGFLYKYLLIYYPTTCSFEATNAEWENRFLVWNFKNTPGKTSSLQHKRALETLIPKLLRILKSSFKDLSRITLVCIPASTRSSNISRYELFSDILAKRTGMINSYKHITILKDGEPKHLGGTGKPTLQFDKDFFVGKYVLLFDDVITSGSSMLSIKTKLESMGAYVVAGLAIGKTKHERESHSYYINSNDDDLPF